jgi:bleomycin hydrolase
MKKLSLLSFLFFLVVGLTAQTPEKKGYEFQTIYDYSATSVKDQFRTSTCWSFSSISFFESEMIRMGKIPVDISEMFVVRHCYSDKAKKYVRLQGALNFAPGGAFYDLLYVMNNYGLVPEEAYKGLNYGEEAHVHSELDNVLKGYVTEVVKNPNRKLSTAWHNGFNGILDAYLGKLPETFTYNGKTYTPQSFSKEVVGLNADDYVSITSFTHQPNYKQFVIEVPDNWLWELSYNVPFNEFREIFHNALKNGYTIAWGADVSEKGFSHKNGVAIVPETEVKDMNDTERSRWEKMTPEERQKKLFSFEEIVKEKVITPEMRQIAFDNYQTTDDHGMHITGMVKDQNGNIYYKVKNSWNTDNKYDGYFYASEAFVMYKTLNIMIHKDALSNDLKKKLGIK